jgi:hypothetical protein
MRNASTTNCCDTLTYAHQPDSFKLKFQRIPRPCLFHQKSSHIQDYASRYGIHFPGARSKIKNSTSYNHHNAEGLPDESLNEARISRLCCQKMPNWSRGCMRSTQSSPPRKNTSPFQKLRIASN